MQVNIKNIEILKRTYLKNKQIVANLHESILNYQKELNELEQSTRQELNFSENLLKAAQVYEKQKLALLLKAEAELARALEAEAAAMASGNPAAIASASAWVARATQQVYQAKKEYEKAKKNRINMEKRVELAKQAFHKAKQLNEDSRKVFNFNFNSISNYNTVLMNRLTNADKSMGEYLNEKIADTLNQVESYFKSIGISDIERELKESSKIERVEGKIVAKRDITFKPCQKDASGRTNIERMQEGLAPIGTDGKSIELHHLKQKDKGIIIEVTNDEHNKYSKTLHRYKDESEIDRREFERWKRKYWKQRAKDFEC